MGRRLYINGHFYEALEYFLQLTEMNLATDHRATLFYTMEQLYAEIYGEDKEELIQRYLDLSEAETKKPDFTNKLFIGYLLFGKGSRYISFADACIFDLKPLQPSRIDSLQKALPFLEEAVTYYHTIEEAHKRMLGGLYRDCELDIDKLAKVMEIQTKTLSYAINSITGKNFNQFVNEYRVKEVLRRLSHDKEPRMKEIHDEAGFNSYAAFYRTFKQTTGLSPRQFMKIGNGANKEF